MKIKNSVTVNALGNYLRSCIGSKPLLNDV